MGLGALGDIIAQTPLLAALRTARPDSHLTWIVESTNREAIDANPYVDEIMLWDSAFWRAALPQRWKKWLKPQCGLGLRWLVSTLRLQAHLRQRKYDVFISFQPAQWSALSRASGAPVSIGLFSEARQAVPPRVIARYTHVYAPPDIPLHKTERTLTALTALGLPQPAVPKTTLGFTAEDAAAADRFLAENGIADGFTLLAPMTTWDSKCWPGSRYAALGDRLARTRRMRIVLVGTAEERDAVNQIAAQMQERPTVVTGGLTFRQVVALIARATLVVSGDTGPMHVAAALGTPYVALFGPTDPCEWAPLMGTGRVLTHAVTCGPCGKMQCPNLGSEHLLCLNLLSVPEVCAAVDSVLNPQPSSRQPRASHQEAEE